MQINAVPFFKYLGVKLNGNNIFQDEINERLVNSNKALYANHYRSKSVSKNINIWS